MCDEEKSASGAGRKSGLDAARSAFYAGDIAATIVEYHSKNGGLLRREDMESFRVEIEDPVRFSFEGVDLYTCGPWCQGPTLSQAASLLRSMELKEAGHNSVQYVNYVAAALNLAFEDRDRYYGDPRFVDVPLARLYRMNTSHRSGAGLKRVWQYHRVGLSRQMLKAIGMGTRPISRL